MALLFPPLPSLKSNEQLHGTAQGLSYLRDCADLRHGNLEEVSFLSSRDRFLIHLPTFNRRTSSCPTRAHHAPVSRTLALW